MYHFIIALPWNKPKKCKDCMWFELRVDTKSGDVDYVDNCLFKWAEEGKSPKANCCPFLDGKEVQP